MPMPTVYAVGTVASGTAGVTPGLPAGTTVDDILILMLENEDATVVPVVTGYTDIQTAFAGSGTLTRLALRWKRAIAGEAAPSVPDPGDHVVARIIGVRGCPPGGSPVNVSFTSTELVSDTTVSIPGGTTTKPNCLIIAAFSTGTDVASTAHASAWTNASLGSVTEQVDNWVVDGLGGGFGAASGTLALPGTYSATTATCVTANFKALVSVALQGDPGPLAPIQRGPRPSENPAVVAPFAPVNSSMLMQGG
jgi:hypothetical protein